MGLCSQCKAQSGRIAVLFLARSDEVDNLLAHLEMT